ncbi:hypothetical protein N866_02740 [Actinotalea ferrariae CF5-4]|uniref:DarT domain-containing protein n=1 Tax=Actinotalea ferrariae CF5-4 TaxID=948458 RepID=A0A021VVM8_9CELL|nr:DUF4433 domain-containing protein [Actinotalea ferrariae]EYR63127.1 hypothetical protein N866_02740 [Actinotalea ferrariae CF5-4]
MERSRVIELHYMAPFENLPSIAEHGILSHVRAAELPHRSVALEDVQVRRDARMVPQGRALHEYVNLYFDARNAMMYSRRSDDLAVVRVSAAVLDLPGVVVTDGNAANNGTAFYPSPGGLSNLDEDRVFAEWWDHPDPWVKQERKRQRQAEVLVPDTVPPGLILGCYTWKTGGVEACQRLVGHWSVEVNSRVYFG